MRILVTGGAGFVGSHYARGLEYAPQVLFCDGLQQTVPWHRDNRRWRELSKQRAGRS